MGTLPRLEMRGVRRSFGATKALRGVELTVVPGEVMALVGENGAGKSTLMKILSGAIPPDEGKMLLDGADYVPGNPLHARESGVAMIYQELALAPHLSVTENILLGIEPTRGPLVNWPEMKRRAAGAPPLHRPAATRGNRPRRRARLPGAGAGRAHQLTYRQRH